MRSVGRDSRDSEASAQVIAFLAAGAIFMGAVATILVASRGAGSDTDSADDASQSVQASGLANIIFGSAGIGWDAGPDGVERLGLLLENGSGLDPDSLDALRGALEEPTDNDKVDYDDALASLGLDPDGSAGFHLRLYPVGPTDLSVVLADLRVAYIGDWGALADVEIAVTTPAADMQATAQAAFNTSMAVKSAAERTALRNIGVDFNDRVYITVLAGATVPEIRVDLPLLPDARDPDMWDYLEPLNIPLLEGDVYPDDKDYLGLVLDEDRLDIYDVVVVGSNADHAAMTDEDVKGAIKAFVEDGGTLIVFGSDEQSTSWLYPLLDAGVDTVNGSPTAPDVAHPMLKEPNDLAWTEYDNFDEGWDLKENGAQASYDDFSHVVIQDGEDVLAVSKEGAFEEGRVILTTYRPREIALDPTLGQGEVDDFMENMVSYTERDDLYLDYGGEVPADRPVALAVRQSWLWDDVYGQVPIRIEVLAWE